MMNIFFHMEPKLTLYRIFMAAGAIGFILSLKENYFPAGWICVVSAIFTVVYLWEELMCSRGGRPASYFKPIERYEEPNVVEYFDPSFHARKNTEYFKFWLYLALPFIVWHVMAFGIGFGAHKMASSPIVREYSVSYVHEIRSRRDSYHGMKIKNMKTYQIFSVPLPKGEWRKIENKKDVKVKIDSFQSIFGLSFSKNFSLISIGN